MTHGKTAFITGITGQDGVYLAEFLLEKGYRVVGAWRTTAGLQNVSHLHDRIELVHVDLEDGFSIVEALHRYQPAEVYNLASQSQPSESWRMPIQTTEINGLGAHRLFDAVRLNHPRCRIYQASSSEMFGQPPCSPQNEETPLNPVTPYAAAKVYAHHMARIYRRAYHTFVACGILFNHESPRRGLHFVTQKVAYAAACLKLGIADSAGMSESGQSIIKDGRLRLGNLDAARDWGFAGDYVRAMWAMLQRDEPDDFVIGTGRTWTIRQLCEYAFAHVGLDWQKHVVVDPALVRPVETLAAVADPSKAKRLLDWEPQVAFPDLIKLMVDANLEKLQNQRRQA